jgi:hypothetical protein
MIELQRLIDTAMMKGVVAWKPYPGIPGFEVKLAYVSKQHMIQITESCTSRTYNKDERRLEEKIDRDKISRHWSEKVVLGWKGLTLRGFQSLFPIDVAIGDEDKEVIDSLENRMVLLWNSFDFENWCLAIATSPDHFVAVRQAKEKEVKELE